MKGWTGQINSRCDCLSQGTPPDVRGLDNGPGRLQLRRVGRDEPDQDTEDQLSGQFLDLYIKLPQETAPTFPLLAFSISANDPKAHGMTLPPLDPEIQAEEVMINKQVQIKTLANALQVDDDLLGELNAELRSEHDA